MDWFVMASLAREGRMEGYLSSVQDDLLTGFGTVLPPDITGGAGAALVAILDEVAPVYPETRDWFLSAFGPARVLTPYDLLRRVLEDPALPQHPGLASPDASPEPRSEVIPVALQRFAAVGEARDAALVGIDVWACRAPSAAYDRELERARRELVVDAATARARGIALERARALAGHAGRAWLARRLYGPPLPSPQLAEEVEEALGALAERVAEIEGFERTWTRRSYHFRLNALPGECADFPLLPFN